MADRVNELEQTIDDLGHEDPGSTKVLTEEGWETADFVAPEADWHLENDGSFMSPDGRTRTWLIVGPAPE